MKFKIGDRIICIYGNNPAHKFFGQSKYYLKVGVIISINKYKPGYYNISFNNGKTVDFHWFWIKLYPIINKPKYLN